MMAARILVVEDETIVALNLREQLMKLGYDVPEAVSTGDRALQRINLSPPDLVLIDIHLKGTLDGVATASLIPPAHRIPIIYLTAYSDEATLARASATNPFGYLLKPFNERELHATIQMALARYRAEHASNAAIECRRQAEKMTALGRLAGDVADDFDDLLTAIYGQLEVLGRFAIEHPAMTQPIGNAFAKGIEKERLVRRLLAFSGRQKLAPGAISVNGVAANVTRIIRQTVGETIQVRTRLRDDLWGAWADANQLKKALLDLAINARDAMPNGGSLAIETRNFLLDKDAVRGSPRISRHCVCLSISDTGIGMSEDVIAHAFEPFFTTKPAADGLGLSLVFGFVRQSGGQISMDSKPGQGTTVSLYLPTKPPPAESPERSPGESSGLSAAHGTAMEPVSVNAKAGVRPTPGRRMVDDTAGPAAITGSTPLNLARKRRGIGGLDPGPFTAVRETRPLPVAWHRTDDALFARASSGLGEARYRLVVEPLLHRDGWDWAVWRPGDTEETLRHGRASSILEAMAAAEAEARLRDQTDPPAD
jgi:signal transduction histidine kinase